MSERSPLSEDPDRRSTTASRVALIALAAAVVVAPVIGVVGSGHRRDAIRDAVAHAAHSVTGSSHTAPRAGVSSGTSSSPAAVAPSSDHAARFPGSGGAITNGIYGADRDAITPHGRRSNVELEIDGKGADQRLTAIAANWVPGNACSGETADLNRDVGLYDDEVIPADSGIAGSTITARFQHGRIEARAVSPTVIEGTYSMRLKPTDCLSRLHFTMHLESASTDPVMDGIVAWRAPSAAELRGR